LNNNKRNGFITETTQKDLKKKIKVFKNVKIEENNKKFSTGKTFKKLNDSIFNYIEYFTALICLVGYLILY